jgi:hypothetical protein
MDDRYVLSSHSCGRPWTRRDMLGKYRENCLCYEWMEFSPNQPDNCPRAQATYLHDVEWDCVTPMWECPDFLPIVSSSPEVQLGEGINLCCVNKGCCG